ncbi:hypothetical protein [Bradyrhizobium sp.]|uniref:hypothetical protein n=1 Tax=Bradyrhizobium sp. TaxID=376 RepID=UPI003C742D80
MSEKRSASGLSKSHPQNFALICVKSRDARTAASRFFARSPRKRELRETAQFQSLKSKRHKPYSASMTTRRTPVRKAAPDSAAVRVATPEGHSFDASVLDCQLRDGAAALLPSAPGIERLPRLSTIISAANALQPFAATDVPCAATSARA